MIDFMSFGVVQLSGSILDCALGVSATSYEIFLIRSQNMMAWSFDQKQIANSLYSLYAVLDQVACRCSDEKLGVRFKFAWSSSSQRYLSTRRTEVLDGKIRRYLVSLSFLSP